MMKALHLAIAAAIIGPTVRPLRDEKQPRKCGLKDCHHTTTHNGGYCCAAHCKLDRERIVTAIAQKPALAQRNGGGQRTMPVLVEKLRLKAAPARRGATNINRKEPIKR